MVRGITIFYQHAHPSYYNEKVYVVIVATLPAYLVPVCDVSETSQRRRAKEEEPVTSSHTTRLTTMSSST